MTIFSHTRSRFGWCGFSFFMSFFFTLYRYREVVGAFLLPFIVGGKLWSYFLPFSWEREVVRAIFYPIHGREKLWELFFTLYRWRENLWELFFTLFVGERRCGRYFLTLYRGREVMGAILLPFFRGRELVGAFTRPRLCRVFGQLPQWKNSQPKYIWFPIDQEEERPTYYTSIRRRETLNESQLNYQPTKNCV